MYSRRKSEDCGFSAKECFLVRFSVDASAWCFSFDATASCSLDATSCCFSTDAPPVFPPALSPHIFTPLAVAQAKHPLVAPASGGTRVGEGTEASNSKVPAPLTFPGSACNLLIGSGAMVPAPKTRVEAFMPSSLAASSEGPKPTTPPHILARGCVDNAAPHIGRDCGAVGRFFFFQCNGIVLPTKERVEMLYCIMV